MYDVAIIGCGVIGAATAHALARFNCKTVILEAENDVSMVTSRANSGILHAGYDPEPGTLMARLNVEGHRMAIELCEKLDVPLKLCGGFVLAFSEEELPHLKLLYERGIANGVEHLELISGEKAREMEPALSENVVGALYAPDTGIINPWEYTLALAETAVKNGVEFRRRARVIAIDPIDGGYRLSTEQGETFEARFVVNAAGLGAEKLHNLIAAPNFITKPSRGEYYLLDKSEGSTVSRVIFQCPSAAGKGVLVSPTVHGNLIVGPNADAVDPDDNATTAAGLDFVARTARKSVPNVNLRANIRNFAGVRANTDNPDFIIQEAAPGFIDLAGMRSPGLSSAPAVAEECVRRLQQAGFAFEEKKDFDDTRRHIRYHFLSPEDKARLVKENPAYGRVICRCETITEGEIIDAIHSPIPPVSLDGIKRRAGTGMGRCQGGFCGPRIIEIMARELGVSPLDIPKDYDGGFILTDEVDAEKN